MTRIEYQKYEDIAASQIYKKIARASLYDMHNYMLQALSGFFAGRTHRGLINTLVIAGQGPEAVPFSRNLDLVEAMIGNGCIAMFDCNKNIIAGSIDALIKPMFEDDETVSDAKRTGIRERGYTLVDDKDSAAVLNLREFGQRQIIIRQGNLADPFAFEDNSVSAFEATLAIHHVTAYTQGLHHVIDEAHRILEKDGLFHWGTGIVDMRYQEEKIHKLALDLASLGNYKVVILDKRDPDAGVGVDNAKIQHKALYLIGESYSSVPLISEELKVEINASSVSREHLIFVNILKDGMVVIDFLPEKEAAPHVSKLRDMGYKQLYSSGRRIVMPLIDVGMQSDREQFLDSVNHYYDGIKGVNAVLFADDPDIAAKVLSVDNKEHGDAARGLYEYYTHPMKIVNLLEQRGFRDVQYRPDKHNVWCNITAIKR
ncbi:MAG: methyltransferase domain-containing protein [Candidatus Woesearchaeota archaeon]